MSSPVVLYEDNHLLVIDKPVGLTTQGALPNEPSAVEWARDYLKRKYAKPGNVFIGVVSRLDRDVSGVLVLARTSKGAARLNEQFRERSVKKTYWAVVEGSTPDALRCEDLIAEDVAQKRMLVVDARLPPKFKADDAQAAVLTFRRLQSLPETTLLEVQLETGRKHQIRVQLASRGWPIVGDKKYGSRRRFEAGIALHARQLEISHPTRGEAMVFEAKCPVSWKVLGVRS
ncbi:MAG: RluA family pseudouridine synthase [Planctomycetia bacterium]|nr:RluA family pseudouridine synthase [Planctomycetia bacterium]